jgi:transcriptional regulator with XRE-family HTH domain
MDRTLEHQLAVRIGRHLRRHRTARGWSQSYLADVSGVPKARISRYENGRVTPSMFTADRLAAALGLTLGEFTTGI